MDTLFLVSTELVAVVHLTMAIVLFIYARRNVAFLAQAWISMLTCLIFGTLLAVGATHPLSALALPGMFHPLPMLALLVVSFLWSINPLGIVMPGYLQLPRMTRYAASAAVIIGLYLVALALGMRPVQINSFDDFLSHALTLDVVLRLAAFILSIVYILNIIILPRRRVRDRGFSLPPIVVFYAVLLGAVQLFFVATSIRFSYPLFIIYEVLFTAVSLMMSGSMIKHNLEELPYPTIHVVEAPPAVEEIAKVDEVDFNAANLQRFETIEYAMQHTKPFVASDFNREALCRLSGLNRHLLLQTLRSQGYNDVHDYITRYRVSELRRLIETRAVSDIHQHTCVGFRTLKTAVLAFARYEHEDLAAFIAACNPPSSASEEG